MPRNKGITMPRKRTRTADEEGNVFGKGANEEGQESARGRSSLDEWWLPNVDADQCPLQQERNEAKLRHDIIMEKSLLFQKEIDAKYKRQERDYKAKIAKLAGLEPDSYEKLIATLKKVHKIELALLDAQVGQGCGEKLVEQMKAEAKDVRIRFLERENARLRRLVPAGQL